MKFNKENQKKNYFRNRRFRNSTIAFMPIQKLDILVKVLLWLFSARAFTRSALLFVRHVHSLYKKNGRDFTVAYLKEAHRLFMKVIAGRPETALPPLRVGTRRGLPLIIPGPLRLEVERRNLLVIKLVGTLLSVYRVVRASPNLKFSTITDEFSGYSRIIPEWEVTLVFNKFKRLFGRLRLEKSEHLAPLTSAGPNARMAIRGVTADALALVGSPVESSWREVAALTAPDLITLLNKEVSFFGKWITFIGLQIPIIGPWFKLGRLCLKFEAAGKVRVFAVTDIWTQSVLLPLHDGLFRLLRKIPQDGTFDQLAPLRRLIDQGHKEFYSFDLSAATDRLPIDFQQQILGLFVSPSFAKAWSHLLVGRSWWYKDTPLRYAVGQPMGALSSWAMLALSHHFMVQVAARRVGWQTLWFEDYAVLGDDLVIANKAVADSYLVVARDLGVSINLSKSLESELSVAEFAKRMLSAEGDLSPAAPRLIVHLLRRMTYLPTVLTDLLSRGLFVKPTKEFLQESPLKRVQDSKALLWELWDLVPVDKDSSLGIAPFLETTTLSEGDIHAFLELFDEFCNQKSSRALAESVDNNQRLLVRLWEKHGVTEEDEELSQSELAALRDVLSSGDDNYEITGIENQRIVVTGEVYGDVDPATFTGLSLDSDFNVLGQLPSSADLRAVLDSQNSSPRLAASFRKFNYQVELREELNLSEGPVPSVSIDWARDYVLRSISQIPKGGPTVTDIFAVPVDKPLGLAKWKFWQELEAVVRERHPEWEFRTEKFGSSKRVVDPCAKAPGNVRRKRSQPRGSHA